MPRRKTPGSVRQKQEVSNLFLDSYKGTKKAINTINKLLDEGKPLSDEQFRFLKKAPDLIMMYENLERGRQEEIEEVLPEGKLKNYVEGLVSLQSKLREALDNKRFVLNKEAWDKVLEDVGYYRCGLCGETHLKNNECAFKEYINKITA
jgi:hypothetical protein